MGLLSPPPPPATTRPLRGVHSSSRYLFKGTITLRFMRGGEGGHGGKGVQVHVCMRERGGAPGTELARINEICHYKEYI